VSTGIGQELKAAFEMASDFVQPTADLAERARTATRRRRSKLTLTIAAVTAFALVAVGGGYLLAKQREPASGTNLDRVRHLMMVPPYVQVQQLAVSGPYLYVLTVMQGGPPYALKAYNRVTGRLIGRVGVPANPSAMTVGPGGLVWLAFYRTILPIGRTTAWIPTQYGLLRVHLPAPGQSGRASQHLEAGTRLGPGRNTAPGVWAGWLDGRVVAQVTNGYGLDSHLVIAGEPGRTFGSAPQHEVGAVASTGNSLWAQLFAVNDNYASASGPLVRLDGQLRTTTPEFVKDSPVLTRSESVWSEGSTIWVASAARSHSLVCFRSGSPSGPITTLAFSGQVAALAATSDTVYVTSTPLNTYDDFTVVSYPVPAACR
jgi:hypothetical protein